MPSLKLPEGTYETVKAGGGPLTVLAAEYDDARVPQPTGLTVSVTVFLDGQTVRSAPEADAPAIIAAIAQAASEAANLRQQIVSTAQSAVGIRIDLLTAAQRNALIACLLFESGAIANDLTIRPLAEWLK